MHAPYTPSPGRAIMGGIQPGGLAAKRILATFLEKE